MGIAASRRGDALITRGIDAERRPVAWEIMDRLNAEPKYRDAGRMLSPADRLRITFDRHHRVWWLEREGRPGLGGFWYRSLSELVRRWQIDVTGWDHGDWLAVARKERV